MSAADKAYRAFAEREMSWLTDGSHSESWTKFVQDVSRNSFDAGWLAASQSSSAAKAAHRKGLEPHLVNLIAGLRQHQVEEAMRLLLDYVDAGDGGAP